MDKTQTNDKCPNCGHRPHNPGGCLNMESDNDCNCGEVKTRRDKIEQILKDAININGEKVTVSVSAAADEIEKMLAEKWTPIENENDLPEEKSSYIVSFDYKGKKFAREMYFDGKVWRNQMMECSAMHGYVTAWQPLPKAYNSEKTLEENK